MGEIEVSIMDNREVSDFVFATIKVSPISSLENRLKTTLKAAEKLCQQLSEEGHLAEKTINDVCFGKQKED